MSQCEEIMKRGQVIIVFVNTMKSPHVIAIPYPAQGHVIPLLEVCQCLVNFGFRTTFVNTEFNHERVIKAMTNNNWLGDKIHLVSIPDGLEARENRNDLGKLSTSILQVMPTKLEELINDINKLEDDRITCVIADKSMGWAIEVAEKMKIAKVAFWSASAAVLATRFCIPKLIDDEIIDIEGTPIKKEKFQLAPGMPPMDPTHLVWACLHDLIVSNRAFKLTVVNTQMAKLADWVVCNSSHCLEPGTFHFLPRIIPIGPLLASNRLASPAGCFWPEDIDCLKWLDQHPPRSVVYVAFGSSTVFNKVQFQELALGLELSNRPFLWVVRPDISSHTDDFYPEGYLNRVASKAKLVGWAPQQKVLSHPSIACFLSHCGWNSIMEGVSNGVPFLCWPYFADQFLNESYICDDWKMGLRFFRNESGIITRGEIRDKIDQLLDDEKFSNTALELKTEVMSSVHKDGESHRNFNSFVEWMKAL